LHVTSRHENILHPNIAHYEKAEKFCLQLIGEVRTFWLWSLVFIMETTVLGFKQVQLTTWLSCM